MLACVLIVVLTLQNCCYGFTEINHPKCCDSASVFDSVTGNCTKKTTRIEIVSNNTNFLTSGENGSCVEVANDVKLFEVTPAGLEEKSRIFANFIPKCCPKNCYYNTTTHSCVVTEEALDRNFGEKFLKIGLPQCGIIEDLEVNLTGDSTDVFAKVKKEFGDGSWCVDRDVNNVVSVVRVCRSNYDVCNVKRCVLKCCPDGQSFVNGSHCRDTLLHGLDLSFSQNVQNSTAEFAVIHGYRAPVYLVTNNAFQFLLHENGEFSMYEKVYDEVYSYRVEDGEYCLEYFEKNKRRGYAFFRPFPRDPIATKFVFTRYAMIVSSVFLALTILYYCCSREKRTVFGKILISYSSISLVLFVLLSYSAFDLRSKERVCVILSFVLLYASLSSFAWLNVMCVDIYWTFGSSKSFSSMQRKSEDLKRFLLYSLCGWGIPVVLTALPLLFYHVDVLPPSLKVLVNGRKCYIQKETYALFIFATAPIAISEICNAVLFVKTIIYCLKVKGEISKMNDTHALKGEKERRFNKYKDRLGLLIKLFLIMGVSFLFEVVSTFVSFKTNSTAANIELVWDTFNSLQGLFIFLIFVFKKRVFKKCQKKFGLPAKLRKFSLVSSGVTQMTSLPPHSAGNKSPIK